MTGIILLDAAIGVFFTLLVYSLAATTIHEALASFFNLRGKKLRLGLFRLVSEPLARDVLRAAPVRALHGPGTWLTRDAGELGRLPSSIPPASFAKALLHSLVQEYQRLKQGTDPAHDALAALRARVDGIQIDDALRKRLMAYVAAAGKAPGQTAGGTPEAAPDTVAGALQQVSGRVALLNLKPAEAKKVTALIDAVAEGAASLGDSAPAALRTLKTAFGPAGLSPEAKQALDGVIDETEAALDRAAAELVKTVDGLETELAQRFDTAMARVTGWYQRQTRLVLFLIGVALAVLTNFDVIGYAGALVQNQDLRERMVAQARIITATTPRPLLAAQGAQPAAPDKEAERVRKNAVTALDDLQASLGSTGSTMGWPCAKGQKLCTCVAARITWLGVFSWLLIGLACTMGGQFWFDALKKLLAARDLANAASAVATPPKPPA